MTTKRLSADEVLIDPSTPDLEGSRLQAIEGALQVLVLVPWLVASRSEGISLVLPWVVVPSMVALNLHGLRSVLAELFASPRLVKA